MTFIPLTKWKSGFCSTAFSKKVLHKNECNWSTCILMSICLYTTDENGHSVFHKICSQINFCRISEAPTHAMNRREFLSRFWKKLQKWTMWIFRTLIQNDLVYNILQTWLNALQLNFKKQSTQPQLKHSRGLAGVMYLGDVIACAAWVVSDGSAFVWIRAITYILFTKVVIVRMVFSQVRTALMVGMFELMSCRLGGDLLSGLGCFWLMYITVYSSSAVNLLSRRSSIPSGVTTTLISDFVIFSGDSALLVIRNRSSMVSWSNIFLQFRV